MKKIIAVLVVVGVLFVAFSVFTMPHRALKDIKAAIEEDDSAAFADLTDFPTFKTSLKEQLVTKVQDEIPQRPTISGPGDKAPVSKGALPGPPGPPGRGLPPPPFGKAPPPDVTAHLPKPPAAAERVGAALVNSVADAVITPENVLAIMKKKSQTEKIEGVDLAYVSSTEFRAEITNQNGEIITLTLIRSGLDWRLSGIVLPG